MMIAMRRRQEFQTLAPISRAEQPGVQHVDGIDALGIGENMSKVPGALREPLVVIDLRPIVAAVI